jgi:glutamate-ammonia-ligase adenylyltransferase
LAPLLACIGGNSPYLSDLALREPANLLAIVAAGPDAVCDQALGALTALRPALNQDRIAAALRSAKRAVALATALADIGGQWDLPAVTGALSDLAEGALRLATAHLLLAAHGRGDLRLPHPDAPERGCGFVVLAMGKLGARELNYSSDVDLILLYDPSLHAYNTDGAGRIFTRLARNLTALMQARDAGGYVFRVDLRLRPDPASTPPAVSLATALSYYESAAQTWERAAFIKARPVAGDIGMGRRFLDAIRPSIWRRHLDFAAVADIQAMKARMDSQREPAGSGGAGLLGFDVKLGRGGIREIEFTAQMLQLVWGGRYPALRVPGTLSALAAEGEAGHLPAADVAGLSTAYMSLRRVEHRLQMVADRQTHALPADPAGMHALATFLGYTTRYAFVADVALHLDAVNAVYGGLFRTAPWPPDITTVRSAETVTVPAHQTAMVAAWLDGRPRALRTDRSRALLREMLPDLLAVMARQADPDAALRRLDDFIWRLPAGIQFFSLLHHNPALLERLGDVLGAAPFLAEHLGAVPSALEGLVAPQESHAPPSLALASLLRDSRGLDDSLAIASRFVRSEEFRLAVAEFTGRLDADVAGLAHTAVADAAIGALLPPVLADHADRNGRVRGGGLVVVALGKAGSREMMTGSDLDLMLIYDHPEDVTESHGVRVVPASQYFARAAQAVIAALTVQTPDGPLYAVDMRLRPSGNAGPVAVSLRSFERYHREAAWTWERLALTRARVVAGPAKLRHRVALAVRAALLQADSARVATDTAGMRSRVARELPPKGWLDVKLRAGGLIELEFLVQAKLLLAGDDAIFSPVTRHAIHNLARGGMLAPAEAALLSDADFLWRSVQGLLRIALGRTIPKSISGPLLEKLARVAGTTAEEHFVAARLDTVAAAVRTVFVRHLGEIETT